MSPAGYDPFRTGEEADSTFRIPLAPRQRDVEILDSAENVRIAIKLDVPEEKKGPDRQWALATKYAAYESRGFGTTNPHREGVCGIELQNELGIQANSLKRTLWGLEIRAPRTNRNASGMALANWGAEDGMNGATKSIILGDC